jgi:Undecaprenyl-phosphate galactose phosphotransferase WbaP
MDGRIFNMRAEGVVLDDGGRVAETQPKSATLAILHRAVLAALARVALLFVSDAVALLIATMTAVFIWAHLVLHQPVTLYATLLPLVALFPLIYAALGLYPGFGLGAAEIIRRLTWGTSLAFLILAGASFVLKVPPEYSRATFALSWLMTLVLLPAIRFVVLKEACRFSWWGEPTVAIGDIEQIELTLDLLRESRALGYRVAAAVCSDALVFGARIGNIPVFSGSEAIAAVKAIGIRTALVWGDRETDHYRREFQQLVVLRGHESLPVEHVRIRNLGTVLGIEFTNELLRPENRILKRLLDVVLGSILLVLSTPLILAGGLLVKLVSRGPMFFAQERKGLGGHKIRVWKLRTMYEDAECRLKKHLETDPELRREWETKCKLARDPRILWGIGTFLRRFSIDELPQLWCVVRGTMSLAGPRPLPDYHLLKFPPEFMELRQCVRPGVTGLWQITVRNGGELHEHLRYDSYYIRNWSVWLDCYILARTISAVLTARGAY